MTITALGGTTPAELVPILVADIDALTDELVREIMSGEHAYAETTLLSRDELRSAVHANVDSVLRQLGGDLDPGLETARATGRLKAETGFPLAAVLHAYRLAGRLIWDHARAACADKPELLPGMAGEVWRIIDDYSTAAAEAYGIVVAERTSRHDELQRVELRVLLDGVLEPGRLQAAALALHLPPKGTLVVVSAEVIDGREALAVPHARLREMQIDAHWLAEPHTRIGLLSLPGEHALEPTHALLRDTAAGRIGISATFGAPLEARTALRQAELAMASVEPGSASAGVYGRSALPLLLAHSPAAALELRDAVLAPILALDEADRDALLTTLRAWFECGGSLAATALHLHYHRNTINHRLRRIEQLTGRDRSDPAAVAELHLAVLADRLFGPRIDRRTGMAQ